jgi:replicative DNA helicase
MRLVVAALVVLTVFFASACGGGSSASDAKAKACDARDDINTQITTIRGVPTGATTLDEARTALQQIGKDLDQIAAEAPKATGNVADQLTAANEQFTKELQQVKDSVSSAGSVSGAAAAVSAAGDQLAASYTSAFANVGC